MAKAYTLRFAAPASEEIPSDVIAADDAAAVRIATSLKIMSAFQIWQDDRLVKLIARARPRS
jgi:hypothetical protein